MPDCSDDTTVSLPDGTGTTYWKKDDNGVFHKQVQKHEEGNVIPFLPHALPTSLPSPAMVTNNNAGTKTRPPGKTKFPANSVRKSTTHTPTKKKKKSGVGTPLNFSDSTTKKKPGAVKSSQTTTTAKASTTTAKKKAPAAYAGRAASTKGTPVSFGDSTTKKKKPTQTTTKTTTNNNNSSSSTNRKPSVTRKSTTTTNNNTKTKKPSARNSTSRNSLDNSAKSNKSSASNNNNRASTRNSLDNSAKSNNSNNNNRTSTSSTRRPSNNPASRSQQRSSSSSSSSQRRLSSDPNRRSYRSVSQRRSSRSSRTTQQQQDLIIRDLLGDGAYHLPGNTTWCQDWIQYLVNTHPVFSICCQHRLHPISRCMRIVALLGSIMIGLVITNVIYLLVIHDKDDQFQIIELSNGELAVADDNGDEKDRDSGSSNTFVVVPHDNENEVLKEYTHPELDQGMLILWTVGSAVHAIWDNTIWYITSCACIDESSAEATSQDNNKKEWLPKAKKLCNIIVVMGCIIITAAATLAVIIRAHVEAGGKVEDVDVGSMSGNSLIGESIGNKENYEFLISYGVELFVAWFLWFPIIETFLFSGIMGICFPCVPCLAGRPGEVKEEEVNNNNHDIEAFDRNNNDGGSGSGSGTTGRRRGRGGKTRGCCW